MSQRGHPPRRLQLTIGDALHQIPVVGHQVHALLASANIEERRCHMAEVVLEEVLSNIVRHGADRGRVPRIDIEASVHDGSVSLLVTDAGPAFDPSTAPAFDAQTPLEARSTGGMGIHLIRHLTRALRYERVGERNRLEILL